MPQTRVKRIVHRRTDVPDNAWMQFVVPPFDPSSVSISSNLEEISSFRLSDRKKLDLRIHQTEHDGWISGFTDQDKYSVPPAIQLNPGFQTVRKKPLSLNYHAPWVDDYSWIKPNLPVTAIYETRMFPAVDFLAQSFRLRRKSFHKPGRTGTPRPTDTAATLGRPAFDQLINSFRPEARSLFNPSYHNWQDDQAAIFANAPIPAFDPALWAVLGAVSLDTTIGGRNRSQWLLWNSREWTSFGLVVPEGPEFIPAFQQLTDSFRTLKRVLWNPARLDWNDVGWVAFVNRTVDVPAAWPSMNQLLESFLLGKRKGLHQSQLDWNDIGWIFSSSQFDQTLWPAFEASMQAFQQLDRKRFDVRRTDAPFDAWMGIEPDAIIPLYAPTFQGLAEGFRMGKRKVTLDQLRTEDFHDFAWLRGVLNLTDAEFGIPRAHWRKIAGAVMNRRRRRKR